MKTIEDNVYRIIKLTGEVSLEEVFAELTRIGYDAIWYSPISNEVYVSGGPEPSDVIDDVLRATNVKKNTVVCYLW